MQTRGVHHIGLAVGDLDRAIDTYRHLLDGRLEHRDTLDSQGVHAASVLVGGSRVELLAPTAEDTPVGRFLARRGPGMHHVAYLVDDIEAAVTELAAAGATMVDERPRPGLFGMQVAFVHPDAVHGVLTEVVAGG
jgi:methylmalonyl-CoA/ethylmalonyl-CoA epimerase